MVEDDAMRRRQRQPVRMAKRAIAIAASLVLTNVSGGSSKAAEYRLDVGDVLELSILGIPDGRPQAIPVELNGEALFPLIGPMKAAGLTLTELRGVLKERLPQQVYKVRTPNGADALLSIEPREISLRIAGYRPVYLSGDIARTGEVSYRPGLTVRQAAAIAGGYNVLRAEASHSVVDSLELKNQHDLLAVAIAKEKVRQWRLESALGKTSTLDRDDFSDVSPELLSDLISLENALLEVNQKDYENQKQYLVAAIEHSDQRIASLSAQAKAESEGARLDEEDLERVTALARKGTVPVTRVTDLRRATLLASSRALQTSVAADSSKKEREELKSRLQKLEDARRIELLRELGETGSRLQALRTQLQGVKEKMLIAAAAKMSLVRAQGGHLQIAMFRKDASGVVRLAADEDTELLPGDVVEISLEIASGAAGQASATPVTSGKREDRLHGSRGWPVLPRELSVDCSRISGQSSREKSVPSRIPNVAEVRKMPDERHPSDAQPLAKLYDPLRELLERCRFGDRT